jgi:hypothetical protein
VHIRQRGSLPDQFTAQLEGGKFDTGRGFLAFSPDVQKVDAYLVYEGSYTDGSFTSPAGIKGGAEAGRKLIDNCFRVSRTWVTPRA